VLSSFLAVLKINVIAKAVVFILVSIYIFAPLMHSSIPGGKIVPI
jgi:hypothetical protein